MINLNKKYKYLIRIWKFPSLDKIEDQFVFQSDFNANDSRDENGNYVPSYQADSFWIDLLNQHQVCVDKYVDWEFLYYLEIGELVL